MQVSRPEIERLTDIHRETRQRILADQLSQGVAYTLPRETVLAAVQDAAGRWQPFGIARAQHIQILALWALCPEAAPDAAQLPALLQGPGTQDDRMQAALALPTRAAHTA